MKWGIITVGMKRKYGTILVGIFGICAETQPVELIMNCRMTTAETAKRRYLENCFRYERLQKGIFQEFWQFGVELIGSDRAEAEGLLKEISD